MEIKVIRKKEVLPESSSNCVTLLFKKTHIRTKYTKVPIVTMYDEKGEYLPVSVKLTHIQQRVPSTLLARWINANCAEKLLTLVDRCHTVERIKDGFGGRYYFTNKEDALYGLHRISVKESLHNKPVKFCVVKVDDSIGMSGVKNILSNLGISLSCEFDILSSKMTSITLKFGG